MKTIYFAGPVFTLAEKDFNVHLSTAISEKLGPGFTIILPQTFSSKFAQNDQLFSNLFHECIQGVEVSDIIVAILDGSDADSGTCVEIGYAFAKNKPIIGIRTDIRISEDRGLNLMVSQLCTELIFDLETDIRSLAEKVVSKIRLVS